MMSRYQRAFSNDSLLNLECHLIRRPYINDCFDYRSQDSALLITCFCLDGQWIGAVHHNVRVFFMKDLGINAGCCLQVKKKKRVKILLTSASGPLTSCFILFWGDFCIDHRKATGPVYDDLDDGSTTKFIYLYSGILLVSSIFHSW